MIVDLQGRIVDLNDEVVRSYGWTRDDLLDEPVAQDGPDNRSLEERLEQCRKVETIRRVDKSGREHKGLLTLSLLTDERGALERSPWRLNIRPIKLLRRSCSFYGKPIPFEVAPQLA
ncbi:MAG TPA: PAS domain-containing protein [Bryobacteraceae bacterium]|nr:PAS domain-containing protein [Bryobacteraceae bacterium]